ncbi:MAG: hypothetical protein R8K46_05985, partial [Mariprofundaceae bacterium]
IKDGHGEHDLYIAENNRISNIDVEGGQSIGGKGIYLNPFVDRDRATGEINYLGFNVINQSMNLITISPEYESQGLMGNIKSVKITLNDGGDIVLPMVRRSIASVQRFNSSGLYSDYKQPFNHSVDSPIPAKITLALISLKDFVHLIQASSISCDIVGSAGTLSYLPQDIESDFLPNLKHFYETYVRQP